MAPNLSSGAPLTGPAETGPSLLRLVPPVLRARDFHLYTQARRGEKGRLTDLWQNGGGAVLGHKPPALLREFKNSLDRGLASPLPHPLERRLFRALDRLFPGRAFRVYAAGASPPFFPAPGDADFALWRPFLDENAPLAVPEPGAPVLLPVLPGPGWARGRPSGPWILAFPSGLEAAHPFPPSDLIPPALLAVLTRGVYDLIAAAPERVRCPFPKIRAALRRGPWERRGIYLIHREPPEPAAWEALFRRFLAGGFLIPPEPETPLILPGLLSPGEDAQLAALLTG
ncbi:MAG: hypothetical protein LBG10_06655 [Treponema sp.]|jgi:hypothetical protein|nr:hypothetical protein [Treponema sp.]